MMDDTDSLVKLAIKKAKKLDPTDPEQERERRSLCERIADVMLAGKRSRERKAVERLRSRVA